VNNSTHNSMQALYNYTCYDAAELQYGIPPKSQQ